MQLRHLFVLLAIVPVALFSIGATAPAGFEYVPNTEKAYLGIGCNQGDDGTTCESTQYWLGKTPGADNVGNTFSASPVSEVFYLAGEDWSFADFPGDLSLQDTYVLRADQPVSGQISVGGYVSDAEAAVDSTVRVELSAHSVDGNPVDLGAAEVTKQVVTPGDTVYEFEFDLDPALDGTEVKWLNVTLYVKSITVLQNGFVDGSGGSFIELPYYDVVATG